MSDNMGSNNDIKGFIAKGGSPGICYKDVDPIRIRAGIPAK
jgi:hypothetical protein